jgi:hypothetical protein
VTAAEFRTGSMLASLGYTDSSGKSFAGYFSGRVQVEQEFIALGRIDAKAGCTNCSESGSDRNLKKEIQTLTHARDKLEKIRGVSFKWNENGPKDTRPQFGVIAQEVEAVLPGAVRKNEDGFLSVEYHSMIALLIQAVKEQDLIIQSQQKQIDAIQSALGTQNKEFGKVNTGL